MFPEALGKSDGILPPGTECGKCNHYFGHALDATFVTNPNIAMALQVLGIPGKKAKVRKLLGSVERGPSEPGLANLRFTLEAPKLTFSADGAVEMQASVKVPKGFRLSAFRRALHHVAMNVVAYVEGPVVVLDPRFDAVRTYIRRPVSAAEAWPYADDSPPTRHIPPHVGGAQVRTTRGKVMALQLFQTIYVVDLWNSGELEWVAHQHGAKVVGPEVTRLPDVVIKTGTRPEPPSPT